MDGNNFFFSQTDRNFLGEPFQQEELEEMLSAAVDPEKGTILYKEYVSRMAVEEV